MAKRKTPFRLYAKTTGEYPALNPTDDGPWATLEDVFGDLGSDTLFRVGPDAFVFVELDETNQYVIKGIVSRQEPQSLEDE